MFNIIDRYLLRALLVNYLIGLAVMMSLYVVLDLFVNMDEFMERGYPVGRVLWNMADYYAPNLLLYFSQLSSVITLFACLATLARLRRLNELTAMLASGVSLYRLARPVLIFGVAMTGLLVLDSEVLIPAVAHRLVRDHDDVEGRRAYEVLFLRDRGDNLLSATQFSPITHDLRSMMVLTRDEQGSIRAMLEADRAEWEPPTPTRPVGQWRLDRGRQVLRVARDAAAFGPREDKETTYPAVYPSDLSPEAIQVRQTEGWMRFLSHAQLKELVQRDSPERAAVLRAKYAREASPIVCVVLLLLGIPFFLDRSPANVLSDATKCMLACGTCYVVTFVAQSVRGESQSALVAWIPIFVFGTIAMVLFDRVRT